MGQHYWGYLVCSIGWAIVAIVRFFEHPEKYVWTVGAVGSFIFLLFFIFEYRKIKKRK